MSRVGFSVVSGSFFLAAYLLLDSLASAQTLPAQWVIGDTVELESHVLHETRQLVIGKPASYETSEDSYPVLYLLDGPAHFHYTTGITRYLASNQRIPEMLVVAIANTDRDRDLSTPSQQEIEIARHPTHGGTDNFLRFIRDELVPWVDGNYRTIPHRVLVGHSSGGSFAIYALITDPTVFDSYIAISPNLDWNDQRLVADAEAFIQKRPDLTARLYMTAGNEGGALLGGVRKLSVVLDELAPRGFGWQFNWMPEETHGSVPLPSTLQGLQFIFSDYYLHDLIGMFDERGMDGITDFYAKSGQRLGIERKPPLSNFVTLWNGLLTAGRLDDAATLLERGPEAFSPPIDEELMIDAWFWLVQGYANGNRKERAVEFYRKLVKAGPASEHSIRALNELGIAPIE
jgi:predicted alpha/beta superfamily hydrolase